MCNLIFKRFEAILCSYAQGLHEFKHTHLFALPSDFRGRCSMVRDENGDRTQSLDRHPPTVIRISIATAWKSGKGQPGPHLWRSHRRRGCVDQKNTGPLLRKQPSRQGTELKSANPAQGRKFKRGAGGRTEGRMLLPEAW